MKLSLQSDSPFLPILERLTSKPMSGGTLMPKLRLHQDVADETDSIPFPRAASRTPRWQPRPLRPLADGEHEQHPAEAALEEVTRHLERLNQLLGAGLDDDDRPRAA